MGVNSRLDEIQAAFLRIKLNSLDKINAHKNKLASTYFNCIKNDNIILPTVQKNTKEVFHIFNIRCTRRNELKSYLLENGIKTEIHYPVPPNLQDAYKHLFSKLSFPISELIHNTTLSLPISNFHTVQDIEFISDCISKFI